MKNKITDILRACGIKNVGFCAFSKVQDHLLDCRAKSRIPENAKTVIMCAFPYKVKDDAPQILSRYAAVPDYHTVCGDMLNGACKSLAENFAQNKFESFCDNSPIPEVYAAATAGLGVRGDNGLLITEQYGTFVFLGEIVTDLEIDCENNYRECSHCGSCKSACPVCLDKSACLSDISQKKQITEQELQTLRQHNILWGCDICQNSCPLNKDKKSTYITEFINGYRNEYTPDEDKRGRPYTWRGEKVINRNYKNLTELPQRKPMRLKHYDYNTQGAYFITICTKNRREILSDIIVGTGVLDCPKAILSHYGKIAEKHINAMNDFYDNISVDKYVIMPNHIHLLLSIIKSESGQSGTPVPTNVNSVIARFVSTFKRFCNKEYGQNIWQERYFDHIIRGEQDYSEIWAYIENNPSRWREDEFYTE